jgi:transcriptional regulator with XRE-family HTH domain
MLRLKELRGKKTQDCVANDVGLPIGTYRNYEYGFREPPIETLCQLADYYHVSVDYVVGHDYDSTNIDLALLESEGNVIVTDDKEKELISLFRAAPKELKDMVIYNARLAVKYQHKK